MRFLATFNSWTRIDQDEEFLLKSSFEDILQMKSHSYQSGRKGLLHVSKEIEKFAIEKKSELIMDIQNFNKWQKSKGRLCNVFEKVSKVTLIGDFTENKPEVPNKVKIIDCANRELRDNWIVIVKTDVPIMGLICEQISETQYRGIVTADSDLLETVLLKLQSELSN